MRFAQTIVDEPKYGREQPRGGDLGRERADPGAEDERPERAMPRRSACRRSVAVPGLQPEDALDLAERPARRGGPRRRARARARARSGGSPSASRAATARAPSAGAMEPVRAARRHADRAAAIPPRFDALDVHSSTGTVRSTLATRRIVGRRASGPIRRLDPVQPPREAHTLLPMEAPPRRRYGAAACRSPAPAARPGSAAG